MNLNNLNVLRHPPLKKGKTNPVAAACPSRPHGIKGFVTPTKSFVKIGITKIFCYNNKMRLVLSTKHLVAAAKFLVAATKNLIVVPNFVAVTKPFFFS